MRHLTDTHAHTVASTHAYSTVEEYFRAASDKGLQLFSITDHGPRCPIRPIRGILAICEYYLAFVMVWQCFGGLKQTFFLLHISPLISITRS